MQDLEQLTHQIEASFTHIHEQQMQGIPLLNPLLVVQTIGFQHYQGRCVGVIITPWMMNLIMFPAENEDWDELELGHKQPHRFPANQFKFMVNEVDGLDTALSVASVSLAASGIGLLSTIIAMP
ncbi:MAG: [NiFe]-hydrogenase assembly chaperone HybE, partial [Candidatus Thiodiazotropha sp. (ex Lucinoma borealis)]|nr:[NiFe]-hydrogenase assembly chaperone HybE [Candidatus Thiodiazotropha sp. (ex Lucinoma borealis)]